VKDASGHENEYALDSHDLQIHQHGSRQREFVDDKIRGRYYPEIEQLLGDAQARLQHPSHAQLLPILDSGPGQPVLSIFDHTIRRQLKDKH